MLISVTHLTMFVHDQDVTLNFYKKLGFVVHTDADFDGMRWLTLCFPGKKDFELAIIKATTDVEKSLVGKQGADKPFISLESTDCLKDYEILKAQGVEILGKPENQPWGISMMFADNSGNKIYVCQQI
jgi:predicted enzyme related to lactoylglutathione lyase